jgi:N-acyl homoserine lactone hydrolase
MKLFLLNLGSCDVDKGVVLTPGSDRGTRVAIPIVGYLIETDAGERVLIDTGMHRKHIADPAATFGGYPFARALTPIMRADDDIAVQLAALGLSPGDIDILVCTHFHFDHAGNNADFIGSHVIAHRDAYAWAQAHPGPFPESEWNPPGIAFELIDGDVELLPGIALLATPGHVPGHLSVVVRLPNSGTIVLAIDAIYTHENLATDNWNGQALPESGKISAHRLVEIAEREHGLLITGHDPAAWAELRHAPRFYD